MKKELWVAVFILPCLLLAELREVVILQTADMHAEFTGAGASWLRVASMVKRMRQAYGEEKCLLIDCGDNTQGSLAATLTKGAAGMVPLESMRYDAWIPGNHELDFGIRRYCELVGMGRSRVICGNLHVQRQVEVPAWRLFERNGARIAVIGAAASYGRNWLFGEALEAVSIETAVAMLERILPEVHLSKPDMIVLAAHQGWFEGSDTRNVNEVSAIARKFPEIDVILGAHSHRVFPGRQIGRRAWYVQPGSHGGHLCVVTAMVDTERHALVSVSSRALEVTADYPEDEELKAALAEPLTLAEAEAERVLKGRLGAAVSSYGRPGVSCQTSELICRALAEASGADVVLHGRLSRKSLPAGKITARDLFELVPYENTIVTAEVTQAELAEIVAEQWRYKTNYGFCGLWGDPKTVEGRRLKLALNNHTAAGSGRYTVLREILDKPESKSRDTGKSTREAVEEYLAAHDGVVIKMK